jgi:transcription termination/antitermination protein NusG
MPLLPLETFLHPEDLFGAAPDGEPGGVWWALFTRPRMEKALARKLLDRDVGFFLPLYKRRWAHGTRWLTSHVPLFPGYLFLHGGPEARLAALQTNLVSRVLPVADQGRLAADLGRVHRLMTSGEPLTPEDRLQPGTRVAITRGTFAGLEGTLLRRDGQWRFAVEVQLLHRGVSLVIDAGMFRPVADGPALGHTANRLTCA